MSRSALAAIGSTKPVHQTRGQVHEAFREEDETMALFRRRSPDTQDQGSSATTQNQTVSAVRRLWRIPAVSRPHRGIVGLTCN